MSDAVINKKISSLIRCLHRIKEKCPEKVESLISDYDLQDIISVNLERAIQISVDIASVIIAERELKPAGTMAGAFSSLEAEGILSSDLSQKLQKSVGFRNISVHEYQSIDWELVYEIITGHLDNFREYIRAIKA